MNRGYSTLGIWTRGFLIVAAAVLAFLTNDTTFRESVAPQVLTVAGALTVAVIALRGFIDQSAGQGATQEPVEVTNAKGDKLEVTSDEEAPEDESSPLPLRRVGSLSKVQEIKP